MSEDVFGRKKSTPKKPKVTDTKTVLMYGKEVEVKVYSPGNTPASPAEKAARRDKELREICKVFEEEDSER